MEPYIKKSVIIEKIERELENISNASTNFALGRKMELANLLSFIDTLEVKENNNVWNNASDFPKAEAGRSILVIEDNGHEELLKSPSAERLFYFRIANIKMWAYVDELLSITTHFDTKEIDLEYEIDKFYGMYRKDGQTFLLEDNEECIDWKTDCNPKFEMYFAKYFYELGLKHRKDNKL